MNVIPGFLRRWIGRRPLRIPPHLWAQTLHDFPFLARLTPGDQDSLRELVVGFLECKEFSGAHGLAVTDDMAVAIAAQACLPVLRFGLQPYEGFIGVIVHEGPVLAQREWMDDAGVVHQGQEELAGEAWEGGPVMVCWSEVRPDPTPTGPAGSSAAQAHAVGAAIPADLGPAYNVVIHEFIHVLDATDGSVDGTPPLPPGQRATWRDTLQAALDATDERLACGHDSVIDRYGLVAPSEFFAVSAEAFFTQGRRLQEELPALHALYAGYFRSHPS